MLMNFILDMFPESFHDRKCACVSTRQVEKSKMDLDLWLNSSVLKRAGFLMGE